MWPQQPRKILSPCQRNCCLDEQDICLGCGRTLTEITHYAAASDSQRYLINQHALLRQNKRLKPF